MASDGVTALGRTDRPDGRAGTSAFVALRSSEGGGGGPPLRRRSSGARSTGAETNAIARAMPGRTTRTGPKATGERIGSARCRSPRTSFALADRHELHVPWDREHQLALVWLISQR
jgi:hypothetical protein